MFFFLSDRARRTTIPVLSVKRSFTAKNTGELPIEVYGFYINNWRCEGYGFKVLDCTPFKLNPNSTKRIDIAFTPDFTLSRVERKLLVSTSVGPDSGGGDKFENGMLTFNLLATLPPYWLDSCALVLVRPAWERVVQWSALCVSSILGMCVVAVTVLEADRILRNALTTSKESPMQPPLDLRLLSHSSTHGGAVQVGGDAANNKHEKISDERNKSRKEETYPDWALMNVKKIKDKDVQKGLKIPDWTAEEERRFKLDTESKDLLSYKRCEESSATDNTASTTNNTYGSKRKNNKRQHNNVQETQSDNYEANDTAQLIQEKKCIVNAVAKSSPTLNRKGKTQSVQSSVKEETKFDQEVAVDTGIISNNRTTKSDNKRNKQTNGGGNISSNHNNHHDSLKKLESANSQKIVQLSEEETSSTTTESSTHDDAMCKVSCFILCSNKSYASNQM